MSEGVFVVAVEEHFATRRILNFARAVPGPMDNEQAHQQVPALLDLGAGRIAAMDEAGIDVQVVSHTAPGIEFVPSTEAEALAREANDELAAAIDRHPHRLAGLATLPVTRPQAVADELRRAVGLGMKGALVNGTTNGRFLDDPAYDELLATLEELNVPLYLHPGLPPEAVRRAYYDGLPGRTGVVLSTAAWGWHSETAIHVLRLAVSGVFDRYPGLQVVIGHMGEMLGVMAQRAKMVLGATGELQRPLDEYLAANLHITTAGIFDHHAFRSAVAVVGIDRMMFSIDFPYVPAQPAFGFLRAIELDSADRAKLAGGNALRTFRIGPHIVS